MRKQAEKLLYKYCKDKGVDDGKSLYYLGGQEEHILNAIEDALKTPEDKTVSESTLPSYRELADCVMNLMGAFDTPISRKRQSDTFSNEIRESCREVYDRLKSNPK